MQEALCFHVLQYFACNQSNHACNNSGQKHPISQTCSYSIQPLQISSKCFFSGSECPKIDNGWGFVPDPTEGAYSALAGFRGGSCKRDRERGRRQGKENRVEGSGELGGRDEGL